MTDISLYPNIHIQKPISKTKPASPALNCQYFHSKTVENRLHLRYRDEHQRLRQAAVYTNRKSELRKVKDMLIVFNSFAFASKGLLRLLALRWKVLSATALFGKMVRFNQKLLRNPKIDIGRDWDGLCG